MAEFPAIRELIPHEEPMILLDAMEKWEPGAAECSLTLAEDAPFVAGGGVDVSVTIEYMAQAVAACLGYEALRGGEGVRVGVIIGCRKLSAHVPKVPIGRKLLVTANRVRGNETLSHFDCAITDDGAQIADAMLTLYHASEPPQDGAF